MVRIAPEQANSFPSESTIYGNGGNDEIGRVSSPEYLLIRLNLTPD